MYYGCGFAVSWFGCCGDLVVLSLLLHSVILWFALPLVGGFGVLLVVI